VKQLKIYGITCCPEIFAFLLLFIADLKAALFAIGFLIVADTITGIWASIKLNEYITSRKGGRIISKFLLYPLSIIVAKVAENYLSPGIPWVEVTSGIIAVVEIKSIFENISLILGFDLWQRVKETIWKDREKEK
jgi:hypothetical protein